MIDGANAAIFVNGATNEIRVLARPDYLGPPWHDATPSWWSDWKGMSGSGHVRAMLLDVIAFAMDDITLADVLVAFAEIRQFKVLALTTSLGHSLLMALTVEEREASYAAQCQAGK